MPDTVYNVVTRYTVDDASAKASTERMASAAERLDNIHAALAGRISSVSRFLAGGFDRVVGTVARVGVGLASIAGAGALAAIVHGVGTLNADAEDARISIAGMFQAGGMARDFNGALTMSDGIIARMREHANALPGEFRDLQNVFEGGILGGAAAGKSASQIEELAAQFMAVSQTFRIDSATAGRELSMMLEGRAGMHVAMFSRMHSLIGKTSQEFNAMTASARFDAINRALGGFGPAIAAYGHSWAAISSTTKDHAKTLLRIGTAPLFERVKGTLERWNGLFERNQARIERIATTVGDRLANAFTRVESIVERLFTRFQNVNVGQLFHDSVHRVQQIAASLLAVRATLALLSNPSAVRGIISAPGRLLAFGQRQHEATRTSGIQYAPMGVESLGVGARTGTSSAAAAGTGAAEGGAGAAEGAGARLAPLLRNPYVLAIGLGVLAGVVTTGVAVFQAFHSNMQSASNIWERIKQTGAGLGVMFGRVYDQMQPFLDQLGSNAIDAFMTSLNIAATGLSFAAIGIEHVVGLIRRAWDFLAESRIGRALGFHTSSETEAFRMMVNPDEQDRGAGFNMRNFAHARTPAELAEAAATRNRHTPAGNMHVTVRIEQTINDASDPDRVRIDTRTAIRQALQQPIASHNAALPVGG